jgi:putative endonuclease
MKPGFMYIITNFTNTTLYIGVTSDLPKRIIEHKEKRYQNSFSAKYNLNKLVYYEQFQMIGDAIGREKQLKAGSRKTKIDLIEKLNSEWIDLFEDIKDIMIW